MTPTPPPTDEVRNSSPLEPSVLKEQNKHLCLQCKSPCQCQCLMVDGDEMGCAYFCSINCYEVSNKEFGWDSDLGEYSGHWWDCSLGGEFEKKWTEAVSSSKKWESICTRMSNDLQVLRKELERSRQAGALEEAKKFQETREELMQAGRDERDKKLEELALKYDSDNIHYILRREKEELRTESQGGRR